jgi:hypothetical protein
MRLALGASRRTPKNAAVKRNGNSINWKDGRNRPMVTAPVLEQLPSMSKVPDTNSKVTFLTNLVDNFNRIEKNTPSHSENDRTVSQQIACMVLLR